MVGRRVIPDESLFQTWKGRCDRLPFCLSWPVQDALGGALAQLADEIRPMTSCAARKQPAAVTFGA